MNPSLPPDRAGQIFVAALDHAAEDREAFLATACVGEAALLAEVRALLVAHDRAPTGFLASPMDVTRGDLEATMDPRLQMASLTTSFVTSEKEGERIGRYKLLQEIGQGGFGTVWMAEQVEPVTRRVALKIIKMGMDTREVIARFEQERQALAMMDHPNIAKVLDAGATDKGRPFFVMELVKGKPITTYCDETELGTKERLELFGDVCSAINHAHQKGIIHRDIKPSNVMVTLHGDKAVVKVIDFGIAKATQGRLTDKTLFTRFEQFVGTPVYMSPEQASMSGLDVDTRSDIYALGILLYELLTGRPPFDAKSLVSAGYEEMRRIIREVEPPKPSSRLSTVVGNERTTLAKSHCIAPENLVRLVEPDLDWIVMKAIDKERARRYETANGLAVDIRRFLSDEAVSARPPSTSYRFQKFARRHKMAFRVAAALGTTLVIGTAVSVWQAVRATHAENRAVTALNELRASAPAFAEQARSLAAREQFDDAIAKLDYAIELRPDVAEYLVAKGDLLQCQLKLSEAAAIYRAALQVKPGIARAEASAKLCDELRAAPLSEQGKLTRESLAKLHVAMQEQQRPAAELMPVARLLGEEKKLLVDYWLTRLKDLPVSAENPLKDRLTVREDGRLALDLSNTKVLDLSPLAGAPLAGLNVSACTELNDLSPLQGLALTELNLSTTSVQDLSPLRDMHTLEKLDLAESKVTDLSAISALQLKSLAFNGCAVRDLTAIRRMPLEKLNLRETRVVDLSPLIGMPIKVIDLTRTPVLDFSALAQLPLEKCYLQLNRITDLSVLRGKPLTELVLWGCADARHYEVLTEIKTLELLLLPSTYRDLPDEDYAAIGRLRQLPRLRQLGSEIMNKMGYSATGSKDLFWRDWDREQPFVTALRKSGIKFKLTKLPTDSFSLEMDYEPLSDLSIFKGAPISDLHISTKGVSDLAPLSGMPLTHLSLSGAQISDFSPLKGLPLRELYVHDCRKTADVAPLAEIATLERLTVPLNAVHVEALHKLAKLQFLAFDRFRPSNRSGRISGAPEEFWKMYDLSVQLRAAGAKISRLQALDDGTWDLDLGNSKLKDLTLLAGKPISGLRIDHTQVTDLSPLRGLPLKWLEIARLNVTDLSPLQGMPLQDFQADGGKFTNLEFLRGMPLKSLLILNSQVSDLSAVRGMPLTHVKLHGCNNLTDLSPLLDCKDLQMLTVPRKAKDIAALRALTKLDRLSYVDGGPENVPSRTVEEFWKDFAEPWKQALEAAGIAFDFFPVAEGMMGVVIKSKDFRDCSAFKGANNITWLHMSDCKVTDLTPLHDLPLRYLHIGNNPVTDLNPLRGMPLTELWLTGSPAKDFSPLRGLKLECLCLNVTGISDLSPLEGMPLKRLLLAECKNLTDIAPLLKIPTLKELTLPMGVPHISLFRHLPNLEHLGYQASPPGYAPDTTVEEFWRDYDAKKAAPAAKP